MVVAFPPGGADDAIARILHDPMEKALGQPIVIENVGGAGGMIAAAKAARAAPDGYTILLHQDALAAGMTLYPNRTFDAEKDFVTGLSILQQSRSQHARHCRRITSKSSCAG
jgi:tripartite-type tricarboxylate transporter receptor subunit TctC